MESNLEPKTPSFSKEEFHSRFEEMKKKHEEIFKKEREKAQALMEEIKKSVAEKRGL